MFAWQGSFLTMYWEGPTCGTNREQSRLQKIYPCWLIKTWWNWWRRGRGYIPAERRGSSSKGNHSHSQSSNTKRDPKTRNGDSEPKEKNFFLPSRLDSTKRRKEVGRNYNWWGRVAPGQVDAGGDQTRRDPMGMGLDCRLQRYHLWGQHGGASTNLKASGIPEL